MTVTLQDLKDKQELEVIYARVAALNEEKSYLKRKIRHRMEDHKPCFRENKRLYQIYAELVDLDVDRRLLTGELTFREVYGQ
jgi:hypothetical protein